MQITFCYTFIVFFKNRRQGRKLINSCIDNFYRRRERAADEKRPGLRPAFQSNAIPRRILITG
jgi:hypothetical protein